jgi:4-hydroxybenzoate polyprenyltransferase
MKVERISYLDYFFVLRPMLFYPGWSTMLAGYFIEYNHQWFPFLHNQLDINHCKILFHIIAFAMLMGSTFVLNQLADIKSDQKNEKLFLISNGHLTKESALKEVIILAIISVVMVSFHSLPIASIFILFFLMTGILYNYSPLSMKDRPWGSLLANALMGLMAFAIGWLAGKQFSSQVFLDSLPYLFFNTALYLFTTLPDIEGDRLTNKKTLAVLYGSKIIIMGAMILFVTGFLISLLFSDLQALVFYFLSIPFFIKVALTFKISDSISATKFAIFFFALSICLRWPFYFVLMLLGFYLTKFYFKKRFNLNYPNFSGT